MTIRPFHSKDRAAIDELAIKLHAFLPKLMTRRSRCRSLVRETRTATCSG